MLLRAFSSSQGKVCGSGSCGTDGINNLASCWVWEVCTASGGMGHPVPVVFVSAAQRGLHISSSVVSHVSSMTLHFAVCLQKSHRQNWCFGGGRGDL